MDYKNLRLLMKDKEWLAEIELQTNFIIESKVNIRQRLWHIDNNIFEIPTCNYCKINKVKWSIKNQKYSKFCSTKCSSMSLDVKQQREKTCLSKYGYTTNLKLEENKAKQQETCLKKYGVTNFSKSTLFKEQFIETCLNRYGVVNPAQLESVKEKIDQTNLERYGRKRRSQIHISEDIILLKNDIEQMKYWFYDLKMPVTEIANILKVNHSQLCVHFKTNLGIDISRHAVSSPERQIGEFLTSIGIEYQSSDRTILKPKELDIWIPSSLIAIELNGLAWHSELRGKDKNYHVGKYKECNKKGIRLLQILDIEWNNKTEIVKSRIKSIFQQNIKIGARSCKIVDVDSQTASQFFAENHIQGPCIHSIAYGLLYQDHLVAVMSFGKSRFNHNYHWELLRFANCKDTNVLGGASKLFSYFLKKINPNSVVSYCDLRWNTGKVYQQLGFTEIGQSNPNYWYTSKKYNNIEHRMKYQKHKLSKLLENFDPKLTEWENMVNHNYDRIWDCGNLIFKWQK